MLPVSEAYIRKITVNDHDAGYLELYIYPSAGLPNLVRRSLYACFVMPNLLSQGCGKRKLKRKKITGTVLK
jgi:hypothetical protein